MIFKENLALGWDSQPQKRLETLLNETMPKRLMRSLVYKQSSELASSFDYVFIARQAILNKKFYLIESEIMRALKHLNKSIFEQK